MRSVAVVCVLLVGLLVTCSHSQRGDDDDEEFERVDSVQQQQQQAAAPQQQQQVVQQQQPSQQAAQQLDLLSSLALQYPQFALLFRFLPETLFAVFVAIYALFFVSGQTRNRQRALAWLRGALPTLADQFSKVDTMLRVSPAHFSLKCTGRLRCFAMEVQLHLLARQDLFSLLASKVISMPDTITYDVAMPESTDIVFAVMNKLKERKWKEEIGSDIDFSKPRSCGFEELLCVAESSEVEAVFHGESRHLWDANRATLQLVYYTDAFNIEESDIRRRLRCVFQMPSGSISAEAVSAQVRLVMRLIDFFGAFTLSQPSRLKLAALRKTKLAPKTRELREEMDARAEKRKEQKLAEEREKLQSLTGVERARLEEKIRKREQKEANKKRMGKVKILKG